MLPLPWPGMKLGLAPGRGRLLSRRYPELSSFADWQSKCLILLVPAEGIEPPTFGLQNRCSTAELSRQAIGRL